MKNRTQLQRNIAFTVLGFFLVPFMAFAQTPRLDVTFTPDPLFSEANVLPGDSVSGTVLVENNSGEDQTVITEAINVSDPTLLSNAMYLTIEDDEANIVYSSSDGTFFDFLTSGHLVLQDPLSDQDSITYTFTVLFLEGSGNEYQRAEMAFDLCVGFLDEEFGMNCGDTAVSGEGDTGGGTDVGGDGGTTTPGTGNSGGSGGGGGGGGPIDLVELEIFNERVVSIDDVAGTALIAWETNLFSTSQVVYGLTDDGPFSLSTTVTNFGYPLATLEDETKVVSHAVLITGLTPGEEYSYRVVSRASPPTVSYEHDFVVEEIIPDPEDPVFEILNTQPNNTISTGGGSDSGSSGSSGNASVSGNLAALTPGSENESSFGDGDLLNTDGAEGSATSSDSEETENSVESRESIFEESEESSVGGESSESGGNNLAAAAFVSGLFAGDFSCFGHILLTLILIFLAQLLWTRGLQKEMSPRIRNLIWYIGLAIGTVVFLVFAKWCSAIGLFILLALLAAWNLSKNKKDDHESFDRPVILHKKPLN